MCLKQALLLGSDACLRFLRRAARTDAGLECGEGNGSRSLRVQSIVDRAEERSSPSRACAHRSDLSHSFNPRARTEGVNPRVRYQVDVPRIVRRLDECCVVCCEVFPKRRYVVLVGAPTRGVVCVCARSLSLSWAYLCAKTVLALVARGYLNETRHIAGMVAWKRSRDSEFGGCAS